MKRVLFISSFFYPQNKIATLRVGEWVKYLAKFGYDVAVLTTKKYSFMGPFGLNKKLPSNVKVIEVEFLPKALLKVKDFSIPQDLSSKSNRFYRLKLFVRKCRNYIGSLFDIHDLWIRPALRKAEELFREKPFDYIISSYSPPAVHIIAHNLKLKFPNVIWIADFRDLWAYNHIYRAKGIFSIYEKYRERKTLANVDKIITVSEPLSHIMKSIYPNKEIYTIENGFDPDDFPNWEENLKPFPKIGKKIVISYLGTIYPGKRDPSILFEVFNELIKEGVINPRNIEINFYGDVKPLENLINKKGYNRFNIIKLKGFVTREKSLEIQKKSDFLLFLEWNDPTAKGVLTGKLFEYLVSGTPILAVGISNLNEAGKVIEKTKTGKLFLEKDKLKKELLKVFQKGYVDFYDPDIDEIRKFSRDKQVKKLISIMENKC